VPTRAHALGELYAQLIEDNNHSVRRRLDLGGTDIAMAALQRGEIDCYPEYTGTALLVVLKAQPQGDAVQTFDFVKSEYEKRFNLTWLDPAPMNNTQALATTKAIAQRYGSAPCPNSSSAPTACRGCSASTAASTSRRSAWSISA
jgi:osmoprotectant transport system substrate-binding protein